MSKHRPLLIADPKAFMAAVNESDPEKRVRRLHIFDDIMVCEFLRYGIFFDNLPSLIQLYRDFFLQAPVDRRKEIFGHVTIIVPELGGWTAGALTPFMALDPDMEIVSTATVDYASLGSLNDDDPMTRPKDAIDMVERGVTANPAAVLGGLMALGDPRVCRLLTPLRASLSKDEVHTVTKCFSGITTKTVVDFYLDWLDELVDRDDDVGQRIFGHVVAGLRPR